MYPITQFIRRERRAHAVEHIGERREVEPHEHEAFTSCAACHFGHTHGFKEKPQRNDAANHSWPSVAEFVLDNGVCLSSISVTCVACEHGNVQAIANTGVGAFSFT